ncbi:hypothetical protein [Chitinophaga sp. 22620]|uniref:hypothetical protein n=1 Tax=Chitinophaga sp. 22620 TaxID=3453952 RepID=UPI003F86D7B5
MSSAHLTEEIIQAFALNGTHEDPLAMAHIRECETCRTAVESYVQLFSALDEMPVATFDFDVRALVQPQLPLPGKARPVLVPALAITAVTLLALGGAGYYFRDYLSGIAGLSVPYLLYCLGPAAVTLLVILAADLFGSYRQKMAKLEYY